MFMFGFRGYMRHAFPRDDLRPLSCRGHDTQGGFGNTLVDVLDTLVVSAVCDCACASTAGTPQLRQGS
jgi:Glycosyl hydrolase family 47